MVALDALVVATALTTIRLDLHASVEQLEWTVNAYNLSFAVLMLTASAGAGSSSPGWRSSRSPARPALSRRTPRR
jgi:hypothetical protein